MINFPFEYFLEEREIMILTYDTDLWLDTTYFFTLDDIRCLRQTCSDLMRSFPYTVKDVNARSLGMKLRNHKDAEKKQKSKAILLGYTKHIFGHAILYKRVIQQAIPELASVTEKKMEECCEELPSFRVYLKLWKGDIILPPNEKSFERKWLCIK